MNLQRSMVLVTAVATLATAPARPAASAPPQPPWIGRDIGVPWAAGSVDVDAAGVWTIQGSSTHLGDRPITSTTPPSPSEVTARSPLAA